MPRWVIYIIAVVFVIWAISTPAVAGSDMHNWITGALSFFQHLARG